MELKNFGTEGKKQVTLRKTPRFLFIKVRKLLNRGLGHSFETNSVP
jgi:hypothetical protein